MVCIEGESEHPAMMRRRTSSAALVSGLVHEFDISELDAKYDTVGAKALGSGRCGSVVEVTRRCDGARFAMKRVTMRSMDAAKFEELRSEIRLQKKLDHPNIAKIVEYFSDEANGCMLIVMELCTGGSLVDRLDSSPSGCVDDENTCATVVEKLLSAVHYCHEHGVVHRDIKLDNIMYESADADAEPKLIDFGYACEPELRTDGAMREQLGTPSYMAPELWEPRERRRYDEKVDLWALGVTTYMLLSGRRPWHDADMNEKRRMIRHDPLRFPARYWAKRSDEAYDFINRLLRKESAFRPSAIDALAHPWIRKRSSVRDGPDAAHELEQHAEIVDSLEAFCAADGIAKIGLGVVAFSTPPAKLDQLRHVFQKMDEDGSGTLSLAEFEKAMALHPEVPHERVAELFHKMDIADHGELDYTEFLAATLASSECLADGERSVKLRNAFNTLDAGHKGYLNAADIRIAIGDGCSDKCAAELISQSFSDCTLGRLDFTQFRAAVTRALPPACQRTGKQESLIKRSSADLQAGMANWCGWIGWNSRRAPTPAASPPNHARVRSWGNRGLMMRRPRAVSVAGKLNL